MLDVIKEGYQRGKGMLAESCHTLPPVGSKFIVEQETGYLPFWTAFLKASFFKSECTAEITALLRAS